MSFMPLEGRYLQNQKDTCLLLPGGWMKIACHSKHNFLVSSFPLQKCVLMYIYCPIRITGLLSIVMAVVWTSYGNDNWSSGSVLANCLPYVMANCMSQIIHQTMGQSIPFAWQNVLFQISVWYLHCFYLIWIFQKRIDFHCDIYPTYMYVCNCIMFQTDKTDGTAFIVDLSKSLYCIWILLYLDTDDQISGLAIFQTPFCIQGCHWVFQNYQFPKQWITIK